MKTKSAVLTIALVLGALVTSLQAHAEVCNLETFTSGQIESTQDVSVDLGTPGVAEREVFIAEFVRNSPRESGAGRACDPSKGRFSCFGIVDGAHYGYRTVHDRFGRVYAFESERRRSVGSRENS